MGTRPDPKSHTWTAGAIGDILTTSSKMLKCKANSDIFNVVVPEGLLCYFSRYYAALLRGNFAEAGQDSVTFELTAPQAKSFITWLYSGRFAEDLDYPTLFQLYIFADKTDVPALRADIMTHIHKRSHKKGMPPYGDAAEAFAVLSKSSGLVRWMVDRFAHHSGTFDLYSEFDNHIRSACNNTYEYTCRNTGCSVAADPCCNVLYTLGCEGTNCGHRANIVKRGQACSYHEHESPEAWKGKFSALIPIEVKDANYVACAGDDFQQSVDLTYLKGTTAIDRVPKERFAKYYHSWSSDPMTWTSYRNP
ncbi:unnamed protein product [Aureobasidium vineae]|uniref:BTB domain-containing protein n=1 Tax=Aureobasidium vineae TaxID=2773715 RepID=A0A9N8PDD0_9PEZI|nr:unnamed protein product [Aureobasidium vineae]